MKKLALAFALVLGVASVAGATDRVERVRVVDGHGRVQVVEKVVRRPVRRVERVEVVDDYGHVRDEVRVQRIRRRDGRVVERVVDRGRVVERVIVDDRRFFFRPRFFFGF